MTHHDLTFVRRGPAECTHTAVRKGEDEPCGKRAVAVRIGHTEGRAEPFPVCKHHTAGDCVPLTDLFGDDRKMLAELKRLRRLRPQMDHLRAERNKLAAQLAAVQALPDHWRATIPGDLHNAAYDLERALRGLRGTDG